MLANCSLTSGAAPPATINSTITTKFLSSSAFLFSFLCFLHFRLISRKQLNYFVQKKKKKLTGSAVNWKRMPSRSTANAGSFEEFFESWLARQEQFFNELVAAQQSSSEALANDYIDLINRVRAHYQEYYDEKSRMTSRNVFLMYSPSWYTPLERTFFWIAGFKPGLACRLAMSTVDDLTEEQTQRIHWLSLETKRQEKSLNDEMAKIQEGLAAPPLANFVRNLGLLHRETVEGEIEEADAVMETLKSSMENLMSDADRLRTRTADRVMAILTPVQSVRFLAAAAQLQLRIRMLGFQKETDRAHNSISNGWQFLAGGFGPFR